MSEISVPLREAVVQRADNRCEDCQLPAQPQVGGFEVHHILPRSRGGQTELAPLALAGPNCNAHTWAHLDGQDPASRPYVLLFNPRTQGWGEHLQWSAQHPDEIMGTSAHGSATVLRLQMNHPDLVSSRRLLAALGIQWRAEAYSQQERM